jgi:hypothetical protein
MNLEEAIECRQVDAMTRPKEFINICRLLLIAPRFLLSFPSKRESMLTLNGPMDSRLRGNDAMGYLDASPEAAWILALQACNATSKAGYASWLTEYEMSTRAKRGQGLLAMSIKFRCQQFLESRAQ